MNYMGGTTRMSFAEFELLPDQPGKRELLEGELIELPPAKLRHHRISHRIYDSLKTATTEAHAHGKSR